MSRKNAVFQAISSNSSDFTNENLSKCFRYLGYQRPGFADEKEAYLGTMLALRRDPPVEEIAAQPDFEPSVISADEFDAAWHEALKQKGSTKTGKWARGS